MSYEQIIRDHVDLTGSIPMIRHPLVHTIYAGEVSIQMAASYLSQKLASLEDAEKEEDIEQYVFLHERPYRLDALIRILTPDMDPKRKGELIRDIWVDTEFPGINLETWKMIFRGADRKCLMGEENLQRWNELPEKFDIFRGAKPKYKHGISWTLDEETAKWFSNRFGEEGKVFKKTISKEDAIVILDREESEVICIGVM